jgi:hypothetical protein
MDDISDPCPECGKTFEGDRVNQRLALHRSNAHGVKGMSKSQRNRDTAEAREPSPAEVFAPEYEPGLSPDSPFSAPPGPSAEVPPVRSSAPASAGTAASPHRGMFDRFKKKGDATAPAPASVGSNERRPKPRGGSGGKRISTAETIADLWSGGGSLLMRAGHAPTGRMVQFQGAAAGELLDDALKGTIVDKLVLQRIVGGRSSIDLAFSLFGPPIITWQMEKAVVAGDQNRVLAMESALKAIIKQSLPTMIPAMKKARKKEAEQAVAMAELLDTADLEMLGVHLENGTPMNDQGQVVDVGDIFVSMLFAEWVPQGPPPASEHESETVNG